MIFSLWMREPSKSLYSHGHSQHPSEMLSMIHLAVILRRAVSQAALSGRLACDQELIIKCAEMSSLQADTLEGRLDCIT